MMSELYELPEGWEWKKIFETFKIRSGNFLPKKNMVENGKYDVYGGNGINGKYDEYNLDGDNIVIGRVGALCGNVRYVNDFIWLTDNAFYISEYLTTIDKVYLSKYLAFIDLGKTANQSAQPVISYKSISVLNIPLPPLQEQKRIVVKLDSLFAKIDQAIVLHQQNIDEAEGFMGSVLNDVFGKLEGKYEKRTLFSFHPKISAGGTPLRKESSYWNGDIEWYSSGELNQLYTLPAKEKITQVGLENSSAKLFSKGTLLIGMYDTAAMKMSILSNDGSCNQAIVGFKPQEDELNIFFSKYQLQYLKEKILEQRQGVRQQNLNLSKIKNIELEYPPLKTQQKTVQYLDQLSQKTETLKQVQTEKMESLKALKASILDQAFRGEL